MYTTSTTEWTYHLKGVGVYCFWGDLDGEPVFVGSLVGRGVGRHDRVLDGPALGIELGRLEVGRAVVATDGFRVR
jgi:hypothetical protein